MDVVINTREASTGGRLVHCANTDSLSFLQNGVLKRSVFQCLYKSKYFVTFKKKKGLFINQKLLLACWFVYNTEGRCCLRHRETSSKCAFNMCKQCFWSQNYIYLSQMFIRKCSIRLRSCSVHASCILCRMMSHSQKLKDTGMRLNSHFLSALVYED